MAINSESYLFGITIMGNRKGQLQERGEKRKTIEVLLKRKISGLSQRVQKCLKTNYKFIDSFLSNTKLLKATGSLLQFQTHTIKDLRLITRVTTMIQAKLSERVKAHG